MSVLYDIFQQLDAQHIHKGYGSNKNLVEALGHCKSKISVARVVRTCLAAAGGPEGFAQTYTDLHKLIQICTNSY